MNSAAGGRRTNCAISQAAGEKQAFCQVVAEVNLARVVGIRTFG
jgi:hypothetical protein